jgi:outer membrane protein OmpA-like peptidoglycan-associated protein
MASVQPIDVKPRVTGTVEVLVHKRGASSLVTVGKGELYIKQQVQFQNDSAVILPASNGLLSEIADVLLSNPRIHQLEVQGHTDNRGSVDHNQTLSEDRANAVKTWLVQHGVASDRLVAKGYGQSRPMSPNVTERNRARNRRVQFIITQQDAAKPKKPAEKTPAGLQPSPF